MYIKFNMMTLNNYWYKLQNFYNIFSVSKGKIYISKNIKNKN